MPLQLLPGFTFLDTHHCVTGSMRHIYLYHDHPISEEMLLGLGAGVSFSYWHFKGQPPFMGGRGNVGIGSQEGLERTAGRRTGVKVASTRTASACKAEKGLLDLLEAGEPVMIYVDMGYLPYFDFGGKEYHFGAHMVVICGYDAESQQVLIADRDGGHPISMEALARARGSKFKPFPPENEWFTFDFSQKRQPTADEVIQSIHEQVQPMLHPPIRNLGVPGMRKAAQAITGWPKLMNEEELRWTLFNTYIFIDPTGGSGGGIFRYMFSRFLREAAGVTGRPGLLESAESFQSLGDRWQQLAGICQAAWEAPDAAACLGECASLLNELAKQEEKAWNKLEALLG